nr:Myeloid leukemia factor like [Ipomoea batatas]
MPSVFGGRDPFDDPFFQRPFGGMLESSSFGANGDPFVGLSPNVFHEQQTIQRTRSTGLIIEELSSDDENEEEKGTKKNDNTRKQRRSINEPFVEVPDDEIGERKSKKTQYGNERGWINNFRPQHRAHSFTFHSSSTVTYGDANGTYYTSSRTRRTGSDGGQIVEHFNGYKEAIVQTTALKPSTIKGNPMTKKQHHYEIQCMNYRVLLSAETKSSQMVQVVDTMQTLGTIIQVGRFSRGLEGLNLKRQVLHLVEQRLRGFKQSWEVVVRLWVEIEGGSSIPSTITTFGFSGNSASPAQRLDEAARTPEPVEVLQMVSAVLVSSGGGANAEIDNSRLLRLG